MPRVLYWANRKICSELPMFCSCYTSVLFMARPLWITAPFIFSLLSHPFLPLSPLPASHNLSHLQYVGWVLLNSIFQINYNKIYLYFKQHIMLWTVHSERQGSRSGLLANMYFRWYAIYSSQSEWEPGLWPTCKLLWQQELLFLIIWWIFEISHAVQLHIYYDSTKNMCTFTNIHEYF